MKKGRKFMSKLVNTFLIKVSIKALSSGETFGPPGLRKTIKLFRNIFPRQSCINLETNNQFGPLLCSPFLFFKALLHEIELGKVEMFGDSQTEQQKWLSC